MSRRRAQKQQEKQDFLDANPELATYTTKVTVVEQEEDQFNLQEMSYVHSVPTAFEAEATRDGQDRFADTDIDQAFFGLTLAEIISIDAGQLYSSARVDDPDDHPDNNYVSLSENGFGVTTARQPQQPDGREIKFNLDEEDGYSVPTMPTTEEFALDGDELLIFGAYDFSEDDDVSDDSDDSDVNDDEPQVFTELGSTEFGIDYEVLGGRGTVQITLIDYNKGGDETVTMTSAFLRGGQDGSLEAAMAEGIYDDAIVSVTGNLQIAIVGIDVTTNIAASDTLS